MKILFVIALIASSAFAATMDSESFDEMQFDHMVVGKCYRPEGIGYRIVRQIEPGAYAIMGDNGDAVLVTKHKYSRPGIFSQDMEFQGKHAVPMANGFERVIPIFTGCGERKGSKAKPTPLVPSPEEETEGRVSRTRIQ